MEAMISDVAIFSHSLADILFKEGILLGQLRCNACIEFARITPVLLIPGKEEACPETVSFVVSTSHRVDNGGLSRSGHPIQPKDVVVVGSIGPCLDLRQDIRSGAWKTCRVMLAVVGVESGLRNGW